MTCLEWSRQMSALREGKLRLEAPEQNGLSQFAGQSIYDLREYVAAIEHGYRRVCEDLDLYRKNERVRGALRFSGKTVQQLLDNQWSEGACLGYAMLGLRAAGFRPREVDCALEAIDAAMSAATLEQAAAALDEVWSSGQEAELCGEQDRPAGDGDGGQDARAAGGTAARGGLAVPESRVPDWVGPSAELLQEVPGC